jgi:hypothetical protein
MKKINRNVAAFSLLLFFGMLSSNRLHAQTMSKSDFEKAVIADFCDSFAKVSPRINKQNMTAEVGLLMLPLFGKYSAQIESHWGLSTSNTTDYEAIGERLGQLATLNCPAFTAYIKENLNDIVGTETKETKPYAGKIIGIEGKPFTYLLVQNAQGRTDKFYWLEFFPGADKLAGPATSYSNKPVSISYREMDVYQAAEKEYKTIKIITRLNF